MQPPIDSPEREEELKAAMIAEIKARFPKMTPPRFSEAMHNVMDQFGIKMTSDDNKVRSEDAKSRWEIFYEYLRTCPELEEIRVESQRLLAERDAATNATPVADPLDGRTDPDTYEPDALTKQLIREAKAREKNPNTYKEENED